MRRGAVILLLIILFPLSSWGAEKKNYVIMRGGTYTYTDGVRDANLDTGFDGELAIGRYFHPNLAVEIASGYFHDGVNKGCGNDIKGIPVTVTAKGVYRTGRFDLFAGAGGGIYFAKFHGMYKNTVIDARKNLFGGHAVIGSYYNLGPSLFAGLQGKYIFTREGDFGELRSSLNGFVATAGFGFRF
jgi:outer membrane protein W